MYTFFLNCYCIAFLFNSNKIPAIFAFNEFKTTGSTYVGVIPPIFAKVTHESLPQPDSEGLKIFSDASYYFQKTHGLINNIFQEKDTPDVQINQGVFKCENGTCNGIELDVNQKEKFNESLKGKIIFMGNALTKKVKEMDAKSETNTLPSPPVIQMSHIDFAEIERQRKLALQQSRQNWQNSNNSKP